MNQPVLDQDLLDLVIAIATQLNVEVKDVTLGDIFAASNAVLLTSTNVERITSAITEGDYPFSGYEYVNAVIDKHFGDLNPEVKFDETRLLLAAKDEPVNSSDAPVATEAEPTDTPRAGKKKPAEDKAPDA